MTMIIDGTNGGFFPSWTTATRPSSPAVGQMGYNTTLGQFDAYTSSGWVSVATSATTSGLLIRAPQILTSGTSYTTPSNCTRIYVECVGGGGSGGSGQGSAGNVGGAGGGGGGYCAKYFTVSSSTAYTYAIGAGASASGNTGGSTTFTVSGTTITAGGGVGGSNYGVGPQGLNGGSGGSGTNGDINVSGNGGGAMSYNTNWISGAGGGAGGFGGGGGAGAYYGGSYAGTNYGGGGSGGASATPAGGVGYQGVIRVWEYT